MESMTDMSSMAMSASMPMSTGMPMTASMDSMTGTATSMGSMSTSDSMSMMDSSMSSILMQMGDCEVAMLWNWNTQDSCFLAESWRTSTSGAFAGSCIGVILLVIALEVLRRLGKETDLWIVRAQRRKLLRRNARAAIRQQRDVEPQGKEPAVAFEASVSGASSRAGLSRTNSSASDARVGSKVAFRPTPLQQAVRATVHMAAFTVAYLLMLIIMSFNGYIFISAMIGAWLGFFLLHWDAFSVSIAHEEDIPALVEEKTLCCG